MIRKIFKRLKDMKDIYKLWIFILALLGTNGFQALWNGSTEEVECPEVVECPKIAEVAKVAEVAAIAAVAKVSNCSEILGEHSDEHHGGR